MSDAYGGNEKETYNGKIGTRLVFKSEQTEGMPSCPKCGHNRKVFKGGDKFVCSHLHEKDTNDMPDLPRASAAMEEYDKFHNDFYKDLTNLTAREADKSFAQLNQLAIDFGRAFGLDTADRNSADTCASCVRPGNPEANPRDFNSIRVWVNEYRKDLTA